MDLDVENKAWNLLVQRTQHAPIFKNIRIIRDGHESTLLVEWFWPKVIRMLFHLGVIAGMVYFFSRDGHFDLTVLGCLILPFFPVVLSPLMPANRIRIETLRSGIILRYGNIIFPKTLKLYRDQLQVRFFAAESGNSTVKRGRTILSIQKRNNPSSEIILARGLYGQHLQSAYEELRKFLPSAASEAQNTAFDEKIIEQDHSISASSVEKSSQRDIPVSRSPLNTASTSFKAVRLVVCDDRTIKIVPTLATMLIWLFLGGFGLWALRELYSKVLYGKYSLWDIVALAGIGGALTLIAMTGLCYRRKIVADRMSRRLRVRWGMSKWFNKNLKKVYSFDEIAAIQVCSRIIQDHDNKNYTGYQINLVLHSPAGERINLVPLQKWEGLKADARRLADFLNVPLLDHSEISGL